MKFEKFRHTGVDDNGDCEGGGNVHVNGVVGMSEAIGGCSLPGCGCSKGHWICITAPRDIASRIVTGVKIHFDNRAQMIRYIDDLTTEANTKKHSLNKQSPKIPEWEEIRNALMCAPADWGCDEETATNLIELGAKNAYEFIANKIGC